jgi:hypothetical protein
MNYSTPIGQVRLYNIPKSADIVVLTDGKERECKDCNLAISELEEEALLSDSLLSALWIVILDAKRGLWRFNDEDIVHNSVSPYLW